MPSSPVSEPPQPKAKLTYDERAVHEFGAMLEVFPPAHRAGMRQALDRAALPPVRLPKPTYAARAAAFAGEPVRILAATLLIRNRRLRLSASHDDTCLAVCRIIDDWVQPDSQQDPLAIGQAMDRLLATMPGRAVAEQLKLYAGTLAIASSFLREMLEDAADAVIALLPAPHFDEARFSKAALSRLRSFRKAARGRRRERVLNAVPRLDDLLAASNNRVAQLEGLVLDYVAALQSIGGDRTSIDRELVSEGPVVRPDGSLGEGVQRVVFRLRSEADMMAEALMSRSPLRGAFITYMRERFRRRRDGGAQLHLLYVRTEAVTDGGEFFEPFFVDLFRSGALGVARSEGRAGQDRMVQARRSVGLKSFKHTAGFLGSERADLGLGYWLSRLGEVQPLIPLLNLLHAMAMARLVVHMAIRWGARFSETRQLRMGCFDVVMKDGGWQIVAMLRPKGWIEEVAFEIDEGTVEFVRRLKELAHMRWFPAEFDEKGAPAVPVVPFSRMRRPDVPDARYVMVGPHGLIDERRVREAISVLLLGVVDATSHECRYLYATALGLDGVGEDELARTLHHRRGSVNTRRYDLSDHARRNSDPSPVASNSVAERKEVARV